LGFLIWRLWFRVSGLAWLLGFRVSDLALIVWGFWICLVLRVWVSCLAFRVQGFLFGLVLRVWGLGFWRLGFGVSVLVGS
jgi:hypothetical protein